MSFHDYVFGTTTRQLVYKSLDTNALRNRAISNNIANVATPGYQRKEVSFEDQVQAALDKKLSGTRTDEAHQELGRARALKELAPKAYASNDPTLAGEVNNVDVDLEMSKLAENQIQYNYNMRFAGFKKFNAAIKGQAY